MKDEKDDIIIDADSDLAKSSSSNHDDRSTRIEEDEFRDDSVVAEESAHETVKKLRLRLKEAEEKSKEYLDKWQRAQADFINLRKRDEEAKTEFLKFAGADIITQLIPVLDSLTAALNTPLPTPPLVKGGQTQSTGGVDGVGAVHKQLLSILKKIGLEESNPTGEMFDPNMHEAIGIIETKKESEDHKILEVLQNGYILNGRVLRPAKVRIGKFDKD